MPSMNEEGNPIICTYAPTGCDAKFKSEQEMQFHQTKCLYQEDSCPQCDQQVIRKNLGKHLVESCEYRPMICDQCRKEYICKEKVAHEDSCPDKPVSCEFCEEPLVQKDLANHFGVCIKRPQACELRDLGCQFMGEPEHLDLHKREFGAHFSLFCDIVRQLRSENRELKMANKKLKDAFDDIKDQVDKLKRENKEVKDLFQDALLRSEL